MSRRISLRSSDVDWLIGDLDRDLPLVGGREVVSIFFGGGTPSLFAPSTIKRFFGCVRDRVPVAKDMEVTLEAIPGRSNTGALPAIGRLVSVVSRWECKASTIINLKCSGRIHGREHVFDAVWRKFAFAGFDKL